jgi:hypothetical protein
VARKIASILNDAREHPEAFAWLGGCDPQRLARFLSDKHLDVPADLVEFWCATGGGVAFETEELLPPMGAGPLSSPDDLLTQTEWHRTRGMPEGFLVFHDGTLLSAVRALEPRYTCLARDGYLITAEYASLQEWYQRTLRAEFASRYGLDAEEPRAVEQGVEADEA